jgi:hypothetical protein
MGTVEVNLICDEFLVKMSSDLHLVSILKNISEVIKNVKTRKTKNL